MSASLTGPTDVYDDVEMLAAAVREPVWPIAPTEDTMSAVAPTTVPMVVNGEQRFVVIPGPFERVPSITSTNRHGVRAATAVRSPRRMICEAGPVSDPTPDPSLLHPLVAAAVERLDVVADVVPCDPDAADTAVFCETYGYELDDSANTIVVVGKGADPVHAACVVLASARLSVNSVVRKRLGTKKASFAPGDTTRELTDMEIGGVTALGLPADLPLWVDAAVMSRDRIILGGGNRSSKLVLAPAELLKVPGVEVVPDLAVPVD